MLEAVLASKGETATTVRVVSGPAAPQAEPPILITNAEEWRAYFGAQSTPPAWFMEPRPVTVCDPAVEEGE